MRWKIRYIFFIFLFALTGHCVFAETSTTTDDIKAKIDERNNQIKQLETEINQYNTEVNNASAQGATLQSTLKTLDLTKKKITTDLTLTAKKIDKTNLTIDQTNTEIIKTQSSIDLDKKAVRDAIQNTQSLEDTGIFRLILLNRNIGDIWNELDNTKQVQDVIHAKSKELAALKANMEAKQTSLAGQKKNLINLKQDLSGKQLVIAATTQEKAILLAQTQNKEETFKALVKTKEEQKAQFEQEVYDFESQLNITIDKTGYPAPRNGILFWPLDNPPTQLVCDKDRTKIASCIVRGFSRPTLKNGIVTIPGHNGVDFRASTGTRVKSVLGGTVAGTGNTDIYRGCYGLGKWVMVNHDNGLTSIYMHLSVISVGTGQKLDTGDLIGYSGNTGNSEAPHLHVSVYATQGVRIEQFTTSIGCKQAVVPLADPKAYLDPLTYFPNI